MAVISLLASRNWIPFFKPIATHYGDNDPAIMLSELANRHQFHEQRGELTSDGYFYVTVSKIEEEINLSKYKQQQAIKKLEKDGLIKTALKGVPAKRHFKFPESFANQLAKILTTGRTPGSQQDGGPQATIENNIIDNTPSLGEESQLSEENTGGTPPNCGGPPHELPKEEQIIIGALNKAKQFFEQFPAMRTYLLERARLKPGDIDIDYALEDWIRHNSTNIVLLQDPGKQINSSFQRWLMKERRWKKQPKPKRNARGNNQASPDQLHQDRQHYGSKEDSQTW